MFASLYKEMWKNRKWIISIYLNLIKEKRLQFLNIMQLNICSCSGWNMEPEDKNNLYEKEPGHAKQFNEMTEK